MKLSAKTAAVKSRSILFPAALLFVLIPLFFYTDITRAQSETGPALNPPVLTATAAGANTVELSWNAVSGAARFELWAWTRAGGWEQLDEGDLTGTSYTHNGLTEGTTYHYAVRAVDANGAASAWSEYASATASDTRPPTSTPTPTAAASGTPTPTSTQTPTSGPTPTPTATASASELAIPQLTAQATESGVFLTWEAVPHAVRYELSAWWDAGTDWQPLGGDNLTGTTYTHSEVTAGTTYYYSIRALNAAGETSGWLMDYPYATALAATGGATSTPTSTSAATATPTPTPTSTSEATPTPAQTPTSTSAATPTPTQTPTSTSAATATPTATASASELAIPQLTVQATDSGVLLTWEAVPHAVRYELAVWWDLGTGWQPLGGDNLTGTTYTHADVRAGTTYYYSIRALNAAGEVSGWLLDYPTATALAATSTPTSTPTVTPTAATTDRGALIALYEATDGANWTHNDNWLTDKPLSTWYGVTADRIGRVKALSLDNNNLTGPLPDPSALINLTYLTLGYNNLTGPLPDLSALINLTSLYLRGIQLTGQISDLSLPASVGTLYLDGNRLTGPIPDLSALSNLTDLNLRDNQLTGTIPTTLGNHPYLGELILTNNQLTGTIPTTLGNLLYLNYLYLSGNALSGCIPAELRIVRNSDLERLGLPYCAPAPTATPTPGATPTPATTERGALIALYQATDGANWQRNNNWLTDKPIDLWYGVTADSNGRVTQLRLNLNGLHGTIPDLSALSNLTYLNLHHNRLTGQIPDLSALSNLTYLELGDNELTGSIPDLGALSNLTYLDLRFNRLSGSILELGFLTNLTYVHLSSNRLTGQIPDLSALSNLRTLYLSGNHLSGQIPDLSALSNLTYLELGDNELTGSIPDLGALSNLTYLDLRQNDLTGPIPDLSALSNLTDLGLSGNQLSGQIPDLSALSNLTYLELSLNQLSGQIPDLSALSNLTYLELSLNQLSGQIPDLSALSNLRNLGLSGNQLSGQIPDLSALSNLTYLELSGNQLDGPIPELSALSNLVTLILSNNRLTGPIPDFSALTNLGYLDLAGNQLCLPAGYDLPGSSAVVTEHLNRLNLPTCTDADLAAAPAAPAAPQNLTATIGDGQVTLSWDAVADAAGYDLWVWDSIDRQFGPIGGALTGRSYTHTVLTDGRNYYYQVRARNANGVRGGWSNRVQAIVVPQQFLPPPQSLGLETFYQKYLEVGGLHVVAPSEVSDTKMVQTREIITGMLSARSDLLQAMADSGTLIFIRPGVRPFAVKTSNARFNLTSNVPEVDGNCYAIIHEFAHLIHFVLEELPGGDEFNLRLQAMYQTALTAGLWDDEYASRNTYEYWAETVTFWFQESVGYYSAASSLELEDYDPEAAKLIEETLGDVTVPSYCKP